MSMAEDDEQEWTPEPEGMPQSEDYLRGVKDGYTSGIHDGVKHASAEVWGRVWAALEDVGTLGPTNCAQETLKVVRRSLEQAEADPVVTAHAHA